jgi:hypothetical protein
MPLTEPAPIATLPIPTAALPLVLEFRPGTSILLLGANGTGKTRLGVMIESTLAEKVQRIGAHRSLAMNTAVPIRSLDIALRQLRLGSDNPGNQIDQRISYRWANQPATQLLSDFDYVVAALYAEQAEIAVAHLRSPEGTPRPKARLSRLAEIWEQLLPHRKLVVRHGSIMVDTQSEEYNARELSDGERVLFYLLGQGLLAPHGSVVVVDEPELHVNRAVLQALSEATLNRAASSFWSTVKSWYKKNHQRVLTQVSDVSIFLVCTTIASMLGVQPRLFTKPVFISYSHKDAKWLMKLKQFLQPLEERELIRVWDDTEIRPGSEWIGEIHKALGSARVAMTTSALIMSARYASLSKRVSWRVCPALASTSMALSSCSEESGIFRVGMAL